MGAFIKSITLVACVLLVSACGDELASGTNPNTSAHGGRATSGSRPVSGFRRWFNTQKSKIYGQIQNGIDMLGVSMKGANGTWTPEDSRIAKSEVATHPNLINGINGINPLDGLCDNYLDLPPEDRVNILIAVATSVAYGEGHFGSGGNGGEKSAYRRSLGRFQISHGAEHWGCWPDGYLPYSTSASLDCVYKIMDGQLMNGLPIANNQSYWSVMRPNKFLETKFMASFQQLTPQCKKRYTWAEVKAYPSPQFITKPTVTNGKAQVI